ncbi:unnamed protein product [Gadus morhua 'NCC']
MPRKKRTTPKAALLFLEQSLDGSRLRNEEPEVRAALHPKSFITERPTHDNTSLALWVSPQFDQSHLAAPPGRRGRRKGPSTTSILDQSSQLSRKPGPKTSVCKFPTLSFDRGPTPTSDINGQPKQTRTKKSNKVSVAAQSSTNRQQPQQPQLKPQPQQQQQQPQQQASMVAPLPNQQTSKRRTRGTQGDAPTSSSAAAERPPPQPPGRPAGGSHQSPAPLTTTSPPRSATSETPGAVYCIVPSPSDLDTPEVLPGGRGSRSARVYPLLGTPSQECRQSQPETLVADTPEQDYGLRVTWRRRKGLMMALEKGGYLSKVDALVPR